MVRKSLPNRGGYCRQPGILLLSVKIRPTNSIMKTLFTRKIGMTSLISEDGLATAVTLLAAEPGVVTQIKNHETDGYNALQLGFGKTKRLTKPLQGHFKSSGASPKVAREVRVTELDSELKVGDSVSADVFEVGDTVDVTGVTKGKGFAGTIKRHNFHRGRKTHGGRSYRRPGSIGSMYPQKIFKGKKMSGQMGHARRTVKHSKVMLVDTENQVIGVSGAVPGPRRGLVAISETK